MDAAVVAGEDPCVLLIGAGSHRGVFAALPLIRGSLCLQLHHPRQAATTTTNTSNISHQKRTTKPTTSKTTNRALTVPLVCRECHDGVTSHAKLTAQTPSDGNVLT